MLPSYMVVLIYYVGLFRAFWVFLPSIFSKSGGDSNDKPTAMRSRSFSIFLPSVDSAALSGNSQIDTRVSQKGFRVRDVGLVLKV